MPTALVTGAPERVPDVATALKSAGFDILTAGPQSRIDAPDTVLLLTSDHEEEALRTLVGVLAEAVLRDCGRAVRTTAVEQGRAIKEIAALAGHRPADPLPWWLYASVDPDLGFADWRDSILCLTSP